jgi:hypothetical protein
VKFLNEDYVRLKIIMENWEALKKENNWENGDYKEAFLRNF